MVNLWVGAEAAEIDCIRALDAGPEYAWYAEEKVWLHVCGVCPPRRRAEPPATSPMEPDGGAAGEIELRDENFWKRHLLPMFPPASPRMKALASRHPREFGGWLVDAQTLPNADDAVGARASGPHVDELRRGATDALRRIFRSGWFDSQAAARLLASRATLAGQDAFFGGWSIGERSFQVIVDRRDVFIRTTIDASCGEEPRQKVAAAVELAADLFAMPGTPCCGWWRDTAFGTVVSGELANESWRDEGFQSLKIVTDGHHVKYRFRNDSWRDGDGPSKPWFGKP